MVITEDMAIKGLAIALIAAAVLSFLLIPFVYKKQKALCLQNVNTKKKYFPLLIILLTHIISIILLGIKTPNPNNPLVGLSFDMAGLTRKTIGLTIGLTNTVVLITDIIALSKGNKSK